ncbi:MAG: DUF1127 domain-containing protein [Comamonadaceae bacterium]|nr:MAG: DUF1127 domain-containing protein [Comamonadaceae bacterium]
MNVDSDQPRSPTTSASVWALLRRWWARRAEARRCANDRLALSAMSDHELADLGIGRSEFVEWSRRSPSIPGDPERAARGVSPSAAPMHGDAPSLGEASTASSGVRWRPTARAGRGLGRGRDRHRNAQSTPALRSPAICSG